jgi:hypothetical protein
MQASRQRCKAGGVAAVGGQYEFLAIDEAARAGIRHHDAHDQGREGERCHDRESPEHVAASEVIVTSTGGHQTDSGIGAQQVNYALSNCRSLDRKIVSDSR